MAPEKKAIASAGSPAKRALLEVLGVKHVIDSRRADFAEGRADALALTGPKSLEEEIAELRAADAVDAELGSMKAALAARN